MMANCLPQYLLSVVVWLLIGCYVIKVTSGYIQKFKFMIGDKQYLKVHNLSISLNWLHVL